MAKYELYGYSPLYNKDSNWVLVETYPTEQEALEAKSYRMSRQGGRKIGGFDEYKVISNEP